METAVPGDENDCLVYKMTLPDGRHFVRCIGVGDINAVQIIL